MASKKTRNTLIYTLIGVAILLIAIAIIKGNTRDEGEEVEVEKATLRTIRETVSASGRIFPVTEVKISSDVSGEVVELFVQEGDSVKQGQLLARIDPDAYQSQVERAQAGVNSAKAQAATSRAGIESQKAQKEQVIAQLENAREIHRRNEQLKKDGVISQADLEASLTNMRTLEANLRSFEAGIRSAEQSAKAADFAVMSAEATLKEFRTSLRRTDIFAPMTGIISQLNVEKGERVVGTIQMAGTELMRVADLNHMEVQVDVSENDIPRVKLGDKVDIEVDAYLNRKFKGTVSEIANSASNMPASGLTASLTTDQVTNFVVTIEIDPSSYADLISTGKPYPFRPGMSASVEINTNTIDEALSIPIQSVTTREDEEQAKNKKIKKDDEDEDEMTAQNVNLKKKEEEEKVKEVVFIAKGDTVAMVEVKTGIQDDEYIQVLSGVEEGDMIISGPYSAISRKLKAGSKITLKKEDDKKKEKDNK